MTGVPTATYRLQFSPTFTFADAAALVPYLDDLGISHVYASPYLKARPGSLHGYDVVDHNTLNPDLGGEPAFVAWIEALRRHGMGHILDFVPNHMGIAAADNPWWLDVLEWGRLSPFADFFDIDWERIDAEPNGKILLPFLGDDLERVMERGALQLRFDAETGRLEGIKVYCHTANGDVLIFETTQIDYNQPIDPTVFSLKLPKDVIWYEEPKPLTDNEKYERMTPKQAARAFFEACSKEDWAEARKFRTSSIDDRLKNWLGGLEIIKIGEPFRSKVYPGWFVPYEIKLKGGGVRKHNLALKKNKKAKRFIVDGGL